jgi:hypothetical protein
LRNAAKEGSILWTPAQKSQIAAADVIVNIPTKSHTMRE